MSGLISLFRRIRAIGPMLRDKSVPWWKKAILIAGIIYLILPIDLIPPLIPVFGWLDDIIIWIAILYFFRKDLDKYMPGNYSAKNNKYDFSKDDVHEANFRVMEDDTSDGAH